MRFSKLIGHLCIPMQMCWVVPCSNIPWTSLTYSLDSFLPLARYFATCWFSSSLLCTSHPYKAVSNTEGSCKVMRWSKHPICTQHSVSDSYLFPSLHNVSSWLGRKICSASCIDASHGCLISSSQIQVQVQIVADKSFSLTHRLWSEAASPCLFFYLIPLISSSISTWSCPTDTLTSNPRYALSHFPFPRSRR